MPVLIDGKPADDPAISVFDWSVLRGDGCFEALRSYNGRAFRVADHLDRLEASAEVLELSPPDRGSLYSWIDRVAAEGGDGIVRVLYTRGGDDREVAPPRTIVQWEPLGDLPEPVRLAEVPAPWHPAGFPWELTGVKSLSYGPNMAATRRALGAGFHDALLLSRDGVILEGPTWSFAWVVDGVLETPHLELGILSSVTRRVVLELAREAGIDVVEGEFPVSRLDEAGEAMIMSTVKEVQVVGAVGDRSFEAGPVTTSLASAFTAKVEEELLAG